MPKYVIKETTSGIVRNFISTPPGIEYPINFLDDNLTLVEYSWEEWQTNSDMFYMPNDMLIERPKSDGI